MKKIDLLKLSSGALIIGFTFIGIGIGWIFKKQSSGAIIGLGIGMTILSFINFRILRRMDIYNKDEI